MSIQSGRVMDGREVWLFRIAINLLIFSLSGGVMSGQEVDEIVWICIDTSLAFTAEVPMSFAREKTLETARKALLLKKLFL